MNWTEFKRKYLREIETTTKTSVSGFPYEAFKNVPDSAKLKDSDIGKKVWIASKPRTTDLYLFKIQDDHFKIQHRGRLKGKDSPYYHVSEDEVIIHPDEWTKERLNFKKSSK